MSKRALHNLLLQVCICTILPFAASYAHAQEAESTEDVATTLSGITHKGTVNTLSRASLIIRTGAGGRPVTLRIGSVAKITLCPSSRNRLLNVRENDLLILISGQTMEGKITGRDADQIKIIPAKSNAEIGIPAQNVKMILESRTPEQAYEARRALLDIRKKDPRGHLELGLWCIAYQSLEKYVFSELKQAIASKPDYTEAYLQLSDLYQEKYERDLSADPITEKEYNDELELYYRALHAKIEHPVMYFRLGKLYRRLNMATGATVAFENAITANNILQLDWMERDCELEIGEIEFDSGNTRGALKRFKNVIKNYPDSFRAHYMTGLAWLRQGQDSDALNALECAAEIDSHYPDVHIARAAGWFLMGVPNEIDRQIADAHGLGPPTVESWLLLALAFIEIEQYDNATEYLEKAAAIDSENADVEIVWGYLHERCGSVVDSITAYGKAIELLGDTLPKQTGFLWYQRASVAASAGLYPLAGQDVEKALKLGFDPLRVYKLKGYIALRTNKLKEAKRFFGYARSLKRLPELEYNLGLVALAQDKFEEADGYFTTVLKYDKSHSEAMYAKGYAAHMLGNVGKAEELFQEAVKLGGEGGVFAKNALDKYAEADTRRVWDQDFTKRPDGMLTGWETDGGGGPSMISFKNGSVIMECTQKDEDRITSFNYEHTATLNEFVLFEAEIEPPLKGRVVFGIELYARGRYIRFARGADGVLVYNFIDKQGKLKSKSWIKTSIRFGEGLHLLTIRNMTKGAFELRFDGMAIELKIPVQTTAFKNMTRFTAKVFGIAQKDVEWETRTTSVRIVFQGTSRKR